MFAGWRRWIPYAVHQTQVDARYRSWPRSVLTLPRRRGGSAGAQGVQAQHPQVHRDDAVVSRTTMPNEVLPSSAIGSSRARPVGSVDRGEHGVHQRPALIMVSCTIPTLRCCQRRWCALSRTSCWCRRGCGGCGRCASVRLPTPVTPRSRIVTDIVSGVRLRSTDAVPLVVLGLAGLVGGVSALVLRL